MKKDKNKKLGLLYFSETTKQKYFVTFPDQFLKEAEDGEMYVMADIYAVDEKDKPTTNVLPENVPQDIVEQVSQFIDKLARDLVAEEESSK
jgi:hypothetical protein